MQQTKRLIINSGFQTNIPFTLMSLMLTAKYEGIGKFRSSDRSSIVCQSYKDGEREKEKGLNSLKKIKIMKKGERKRRIFLASNRLLSLDFNRGC